MNANVALEQLRQARVQGRTRDEDVTLNPVERGVTMTWLAAAFGMTENQVRYRLRGCPIKKQAARGTKMVTTLYDLKVAAAYLVAPKIPTREFMKALKRGDLPPVLQDQVWSAMLKRQQWEENAQELWRTGKIRDVLAEAFQSMKAQMMLWAENVERETELSEKQRTMIVDMKDALADELYNALVKQMENVGTGSQITELADLFGETETAAQIVNDEEDWSDVI